jgi:hypothetical protein
MDPAPPSPPPRFRSHLRAATSASAVPYGYTITIWSSGTVSVDVLGVPHLGKVLLFMAGAVAGFVAVKGAAFGTAGTVTRVPAAESLALWGFAHWLSAGAAIVLLGRGPRLRRHSELGGRGLPRHLGLPRPQRRADDARGARPAPRATR